MTPAEVAEIEASTTGPPGKFSPNSPKSLSGASGGGTSEKRGSHFGDA